MNGNCGSLCNVNSPCCVCIGGVNYTKACSACGSQAVSMSTANPNPAVNQNPSSGGGCGGASCLQGTLNTIGKWGFAIVGAASGAPTAVGPKGAAVGTNPKATVAQAAISGSTLILIVVVVGGLILLSQMD